MNDHSQDVSQSSPLADVNVAKIHAISHDTKKKKKRADWGNPHGIAGRVYANRERSRT